MLCVIFDLDGTLIDSEFQPEGNGGRPLAADPSIRHFSELEDVLQRIANEICH